MVMVNDTGDAERASLSVVIDTTKASIARVYDAFLDGRDNYEIDRQVMNDVLRIAPHSKLVAKATRRWLARVVRYLATAGIDQFVDCGSGIPTAENTHQVAQRHNPDAVVVYVDIDPVVSTYGRALLVENDRTHFVQADVRRAQVLLAHPTMTKYLDFTRPIGMIQCAIMHHIDDEDHPAALMAEYIDALPSGSFVGLATSGIPMTAVRPARWPTGSTPASAPVPWAPAASARAPRWRPCWLAWTCLNPDSSSSTSGGPMVPCPLCARWWNTSSSVPSAASRSTPGVNQRSERPASDRPGP